MILLDFRHSSWHITGWLGTAVLHSAGCRGAGTVGIVGHDAGSRCYG
jgi:hypothetical protein